MQANYLSPSPSTQTFHLDCGDGTRYSALIDVARVASLPANELPSVIDIRQEGLRKEAHWNQYLNWLVGVYQHVADMAGKSIVMLMVSPASTFVAVVCEPGQSPQLCTLPLPQ